MSFDCITCYMRFFESSQHYLFHDNVSWSRKTAHMHRQIKTMLYSGCSAPLSFCNVDLVFIPLRHGDDFVLLITHYMNKRRVFLDKKKVFDFEKVYSRVPNRVFEVIYSFFMPFGRLNLILFPMKKYKQVQQCDKSTSGSYVLNWCLSFEGKYFGEMSSL